jgi:hypothetical protein
MANKWITYPVSSITPPEKTLTIPIRVDVAILADNRMNIEQNKKLFTYPREVLINKKRYCINSEEHYRKEPVVNQITKLLVEHINKAKLFTNASYQKSSGNDFVLSGTLNSFYGEQEFSTNAVIGAKLGIVGVPATRDESSGKIVIEISELRLMKKDGSQVFHFENFRKEYTGDFLADPDCWCVYQNINEKLQDFNTQLIEKLRKDLSEAKR